MLPTSEITIGSPLSIETTKWNYPDAPPGELIVTADSAASIDNIHALQIAAPGLAARGWDGVAPGAPAALPVRRLSAAATQRAAARAAWPAALCPLFHSPCKAGAGAGTGTCLNAMMHSRLPKLRFVIFW